MSLVSAAVPNLLSTTPTSYCMSSDNYPELNNYIFTDDEQEYEDDDLTWPEIKTLLVQNEVSHTLDNKVVERFDINHIASNDPGEDQHCFKVEDPNSLLFGVFDGHGGPECAEIVRNILPNKVLERIEALDIHALETEASRVEAVTRSIQNCFVDLDEDISKKALQEIVTGTGEEPGEDFLAAVSGSCALLTYIDTVNSDLYIANTGDSRAVIGVCDENGWRAETMSNDHTAQNLDEQKRMHEEHPNEHETLFSLDRVLGLLAPTRAFGDYDLKWDYDTQSGIPNQYFPDVRASLEHYHSPPYISSLPEVQHRHLTSSDRFLILASDGLYDELNNDQIVQLVASHLRQHPRQDESRWCFTDENASTHLIRNAFGGSNQRSLTYKLAPRPPYSRSTRDDITVMVIFFNEAGTN
ncbi:protein serine/threonine phosphatase 2C [Basidiobolus meristosporus CBS 931.73]|uniref:Protein serine/threonine phosphatase 2C n=1 Tax=Basidiobolus meristosporus CBS 931.73 TaxID=1314790 RepID=A0A1Y1YPV2_9FUNG|nr:protein serine/threonine phosphatase 2C [Basidiobolus meristosporus CBS 931.73]|eukprot:ORY00042.1 protein serine/threonine phosphatase 2C [Basidiobolus meristosporus CBS 931.73]